MEAVLEFFLYLQKCHSKRIFLQNMEDSLVLAVLQSDIQTALSLLASGACTNIVPPVGKPLLHLALALDSETQALAMAQILLLNGANPDVKDKQGRTALQEVKELGRVDLEKLLLDFSAGGSSKTDSDVAFLPT